jgi:ribosomal protein S18 acetylase RimI-like enzyme
MSILSASPIPTTPEVLLHFDLPRPQVLIRLLEERDLRLLEWHGGEDLRTFYDWQWQSHLSGEREVMVADFHGFPIGQVAIQWTGKIHHPQIPDIQSLRVMEVFRGQGIGSKLIEVCESEVLRRNYKQIGLAVGLENPHAKRLYERLGYQVLGTPYPDKWHYQKTNGEIVFVEEVVVDLVKQIVP